VGMATGRLYDRTGEFGQSVQSLLLEPLG
jgi:hypothetical protein